MQILGLEFTFSFLPLFGMLMFVVVLFIYNKLVIPSFFYIQVVNQITSTTDCSYHSVWSWCDGIWFHEPLRFPRPGGMGRTTLPLDVTGLLHFPALRSDDQLPQIFLRVTHPEEAYSNKHAKVSDFPCTVLSCSKKSFCSHCCHRKNTHDSQQRLDVWQIILHKRNETNSCYREENIDMPKMGGLQSDFKCIHYKMLAFFQISFTFTNISMFQKNEH